MRNIYIDATLIDLIPPNYKVGVITTFSTMNLTNQSCFTTAQDRKETGSSTVYTCIQVDLFDN